MTALDPREQFQKFHEKEFEEWRHMASSRTVQLALSYAVADMGTLSYSQENMRGANLLIHHLLNLPTPIITAAERFPAKQLQEEEPTQPS